MIVVQIYIDDILVTNLNVQLIENVIHHLSYEFALKDLGEFNYFFFLRLHHLLKACIFLRQNIQEISLRVVKLP